MRHSTPNLHPPATLPVLRLCGRLSFGGWVVAAVLIATTLQGAAQETPEPLAPQRIYPPAATVGQRVTRQLEGKLPRWPINCWTDRADVTVHCGAESGQIELEVAADAPAGIVWLRFFDDHSAADLLPVLIEPLPITLETEGNDTIAGATPGPLPGIWAGKLQKANEVDCWRVDLEENQTLVVSLIGHRYLGSPMDAVLQLVDADGHVLLQSDDDRGLDPLLVYHTHQAGSYIVRAFAFPDSPNSTIGFAGSDDMLYVLQASVGPTLDYPLPLLAPAEHDPADGQIVGWNLPPQLDLRLAPATSISPPIVSLRHGLGWYPRPVLSVPPQLRIEADASSEPRTRAEAPEPLAISAEQLPALISGVVRSIDQPAASWLLPPPAQADGLRAELYSQSQGLHLDGVLTATDSESNKQLTRVDDPAGNQFDPRLSLAANASASPVLLQLEDLFGSAGPRHGYSLLIEAGPVAQTARLNYGAQRISGTAGEPLEVTVAIDRLGGFNLSLELFVLSLPTGVRCEPAISQPEEDSAKSVTLTLHSDPETLFQGAIQIFAQRRDAADPESIASTDDDSDQATEDATVGDETDRNEIDGAELDEGAALDEGVEQGRPSLIPHFGPARVVIRDGFSADHIWLTLTPPPPPTPETP